MNDRQAIIAAPDSDTVRLVYADWLEESGGDPELARLIRDQIRNPERVSDKDLIHIRHPFQGRTSFGPGMNSSGGGATRGRHF